RGRPLASIRRQASSHRYCTGFKVCAVPVETMQVVRFLDKKRNTLVYLVYSDRIVEGSPQNAVTAIPILPWAH
ncbi:CreA family protein, partial [Pseudomonas sp. NPDC008258]|uniref:CreA family protein n=1 Tax=Pseudomonas sp. NPDC008258 TaxID=3364418 RepID=UPI0036EA7B39